MPHQKFSIDSVVVMLKVIIIYQRTLLVVTFLVRSCFTPNGMPIPSETWVLLLTLYHYIY